MRYLRPFLVAILLFVLIGVAWFWWNSPAKVDMASYAPADSLAYLELNSIEDVTRAIEQGKAWQSIAPVIGVRPSSENHWLTIAAKSGLGPTRAVIFSRAQVALVLAGMNTVEENDTLRVKPEAALLIETHTSKWRIKSTVSDAIQKLANYAYGRAVCVERTDDADYIDCASPDGEHRITAAIDGSLIVIANTTTAVRNCLDAKRGAKPSLKTDSEMQLARAGLKGDKSLAFGYISSNNSAKLFSWAAPLLMGRMPSNGQLDQLLNSSAAKILRGVSWTSTATTKGIEDRFLFSLDSNVAARLKPAFELADADKQFWNFVPSTFQSLTIYRSKDPVEAWSSLDAAVALKLDTVSSVIVGTLLKSGLSVYGIQNPKALLACLSSPVITLKPSSLDTGSVLLAKIADETKLRPAIGREIFGDETVQILNDLEIDPSDKFTFATVIHDGYLLIGKTEDIRTCLRALRNHQVAQPGQDPMLSNKAMNDTAGIITYANDEARMKSFAEVMVAAKGGSVALAQTRKLEDTIEPIAFSKTETELHDNKIERKTTSAFGVFSTLLSFIQPQTSPSTR